MYQDKQLSIELQSARNAVYNALGSKISEMTCQDLMEEVFKTWKLTKALEGKANRFSELQGELEELDLMEEDIISRRKQLSELS